MPIFRSLCAQPLSPALAPLKLPGKSDEIYHLPQLQEVQRNCQGLCDDEIQLSQYEYEQSQKVQAIREVRKPVDESHRRAHHYYLSMPSSVKCGLRIGRQRGRMRWKTCVKSVCNCEAHSTLPKTSLNVWSAPIALWGSYAKWGGAMKLTSSLLTSIRSRTTHKFVLHGRSLNAVRKSLPGPDSC